MKFLHKKTYYGLMFFQGTLVLRLVRGKKVMDVTRDEMFNKKFAYVNNYYQADHDGSIIFGGKVYHLDVFCFDADAKTSAKYFQGFYPEKSLLFNTLSIINKSKNIDIDFEFGKNYPTHDDFVHAIMKTLTPE